MRNSILATVLGTIAALALAGCAARGQPATEPRSETTTTSVVVESGAATAGVPGGIAPESGATSASGAPASPMEGACPQPMIHTNAFDRADCVSHCRGMDETVPVGSKCVSQYESCAAQCNRQFRFR